jgi:hypothetical protein
VEKAGRILSSLNRSVFADKLLAFVFGVDYFEISGFLLRFLWKRENFFETLITNERVGPQNKSSSWLTRLNHHVRVYFSVWGNKIFNKKTESLVRWPQLPLQLIWLNILATIISKTDLRPLISTPSFTSFYPS